MAILPSPSAFGDLGLGSNLQQQVTDETEEEKRRKRLGLSVRANGSASVQQLFGLSGMGGTSNPYSLGGVR